MIYEKAFIWWATTEKGQMPINTTYQSALIFGGGVGQGALPGQVDLNKSGDRIVEGIRLYRSGLVKRLYFSGEPIFADQPVSQAQFAFEKYLIQMGVDMCDVTIDPYARNTAENLERFDEMLRPEDRTKPILAISSGWHLPRIMKGLDSYKLNITPYAVDMSSTSKITDWKDLWPSWNTVLAWQQLIKEWVGYNFISIQIITAKTT